MLSLCDDTVDASVDCVTHEIVVRAIKVSAKSLLQSPDSLHVALAAERERSFSSLQTQSSA